MDASEHLPGCDLRHKPDQVCLDPGDASREIGGRSSPGINKEWRFWLPVIAAGLLAVALVSPLVFVGVVVYREGIFDQAPGLPEYARPAEALEIATEKPGCDQTDDWGPYYRETLFGSDLGTDIVRSNIRTAMEGAGWNVNTRPDDSLSVFKRGTNVRLSYFFDDRAASLYMRRHIPEAKRFETQILVRVTDCPPV